MYDINKVESVRKVNDDMRFFKKFIYFFVVVVVMISGLTVGIMKALQSIPNISRNSEQSKIVYYAEDFDIEVLKSNTDYDEDGIDDYTDILEGALIEAANKPKYKDVYYNGGYPPEDEGVCSDVIWRSLKNAGYSLKDMIDKDIQKNMKDYPRVDGKPDPNIDFRRVKNLMVYFERNHISLTTDIYEIDQWQPGDIVVAQHEGLDHIGIISDKRNEKGIPYLIHNGGQENREEDILEAFERYDWPITAHYRLKDLSK